MIIPYIMENKKSFETTNFLSLVNQSRNPLIMTRFLYTGNDWYIIGTKT